MDRIRQVAVSILPGLLWLVAAAVHGAEDHPAAKGPAGQRAI